MFDKPKRKRKQKKGKRQPIWQTVLPWLLLSIAFAMLGYAYMLETRPTPATLQAIQDRDIAERTPEFGSDTRDLTGRSSSTQNNAPVFDNTMRDLTNRSSLEPDIPDNTPVNTSERTLRNRVVDTAIQADWSPQLCELYSVSGCQD